MADKIIKGLTPSMRWITELMSLFQTQAIVIPPTYREKVLAVKELLNDDPSGLVNTVLDFSINCALVDYRIETDNENLTEELNKWLTKINEDLRGSVPTGLHALAKEYFRERWKGSSQLLLRTFFNKKNGLDLPTSMFFVDGEDIKVESNSTDGVVRLGDETYYIRVGNSSDIINTKGGIKGDIKLPTKENECIFVQKPYEAWGVYLPVPYIIKKGIYRNSKFLALMSQKGEFIVGKALEYLLIVKKGTERLALDGHITYDAEDLKKASEDLKDVVAKKKTEPGFPSFHTNFDTEITEYIPEYQKAINSTIYAPIEQRILAGLGLVDIVEGAASTRREAILNPKPFMAEVDQGINDFKALLNDVIATIIERNSASHRKWMNAEIKIISSPVKSFINKDFRDILRSVYDRGCLSKQSLVELVGNLDFGLEVQRRAKETKDGMDEKLYPPVTQNQEDNSTETAPETNLPDRKAPVEKKNFKQAFAFAEVVEDILEEGKVVKQSDGWHVISKEGKNLGGPYKTKKEAVERLKEVEHFKNQ